MAKNGVDERKGRAKRGLALRMAVTGGLLVVLLAGMEWRNLGRLLLGADGRLLAGVLFLAPLAVAGLALRLQRLLRVAGEHEAEDGLPLRFREVLRVTWGGQFFNSYLPGSTGGDIYKICELCRLFPRSCAEAVAAVVSDRLFALLALIGLAGVSMAAVPLPWARLADDDGLAVPGWIICAIVVIVLLAVIAGGAAAAGAASVRTWILRLLVRVTGVLKQALRYFRGGAVTWTALGLAMMVHVFNFGLVFLLARALGIGLTFSDVAALMPVLMLAMLLPVTINGHGLREVLMAGAFAWLQVSADGGAIGPRECAVALSLVMVACDLLCATPGGIWFLLHRRNREAGAGCTGSGPGDF
ncbi:membrane protein [Opitutaceae bacterium TAV5]|nr:membrane protein [Opitutaceae bacterium TAV5]